MEYEPASTSVELMVLRYSVCAMQPLIPRLAPRHTILWFSGPWIGVCHHRPVGTTWYRLLVFKPDEKKHTDREIHAHI